MIGIKDTLELTASIYGGNRLSDKIRTAGIKIPTKASNALDGTAHSESRFYRSQKTRSSGKLIALPGISDELSRYRPQSTPLAA